jgi:hypothetical protein
MSKARTNQEKAALRKKIMAVGEQLLEQEGWTISKGAGKYSVRRITKGGLTKLAAIRTTQDETLAFSPDAQGKSWGVLSKVDFVVAVSVDDQSNPQFANAHFFPAEEMRSRMNRAYAARKGAGHVIPPGRAVWVALYRPEADSPSRVGAGAGLAYPAKLRVRLLDATDTKAEEQSARLGRFEPLTIAEAKQRLALTYNMKPEDIRILF